MKFSIIIPTLGRETLERTLKSILEQSHSDWEVILMVDPLHRPINPNLLEDHRILVYEVQKPRGENDYGNRARRQAFAHVTGDYILHQDDDDYYCDQHAFKQLDRICSAEKPDILFFPAIRYGTLFLNKAGPGAVMGNQYAYRPVIGEYLSIWPETNLTDYMSDWFFLKDLMDRTEKIDYAFELSPLVNVDQSNHGL